MPTPIALTETEMDSITRAASEMMAAALGPERAAEALTRLSNAEGLLRAPRTTLDALGELIKSAPPVDEAAFDRFARPRVRRVNEITRRSLATNPMLQQPRARELMDFLRTHAAHVDAERLEDLVERGIVRLLVPAEVVPAMVATPQNLFEPTVEEAARILRDAIEGWYKHLVILLVDLTCVAQGQPRPPRLRRGKATLGTWMHEARALWARWGGPLASLDADLCAIRNAFSHEALDIDVRTETVASPLDPRLALSRIDFAAFTHATFMKLCSLWVALLATKVQRRNRGAGANHQDRRPSRGVIRSE